MGLIGHGEDRCNCVPSREDPSVIGACACPEHGMKALIRERDEARQQLRGAVSRAEKAEAEVERMNGLLEAQGRSWGQKLEAAEKRSRRGGQ